MGLVMSGSEESMALVESAERLVRERYDYSEQRAVLSGEAGWLRERWLEFAELGWLGAGVSEEGGGLGLPPSVTTALATAVGPAAMSEPLLHQLVCLHLLDGCAPHATRQGLLDAGVQGETVFAWLDLRQATSGSLTISRTDKTITLAGAQRGVLDGGIADVLLLTLPDERLVALPLDDTAGLARAARRGADGRLFADLTASGVAVPETAALVCADAVVSEARSLFALLLAGESLGIMRSLLTLTCAYLAQRQQFGRKLSDFQVLQHRLVDMHLDCVRVESLVELARVKCDEAGLLTAAPFVAAAKAQAGLVGRRVGEEAVQLHGGIGMTDELVVGHYLKRLVMNGMLGGSPAEQLERAAAGRRLVSVGTDN
jgi:alkylation response protein AidB-like acyl-CoA dehydrogenase